MWRKRVTLGINLRCINYNEVDVHQLKDENMQPVKGRKKRKLEESKRLRVDGKAREALEKAEGSPLVEACAVTQCNEFSISCWLCQPP